MNGWRDRSTLEPSITAMVVRAAHMNGSGWRYPVYRRARQAVRRAVWVELAALVLCLGVLVWALWMAGR